jgi:hypothetical protein
MKVNTTTVALRTVYKVSEMYIMLSLLNAISPAVHAPIKVTSMYRYVDPSGVTDPAGA